MPLVRFWFSGKKHYLCERFVFSVGISGRFDLRDENRRGALPADRTAAAARRDGIAALARDSVEGVEGGRSEPANCKH